MSTADPTSKELLDYAFSTWVYVLHASGVAIQDDAVRADCAAIAAATDETTGNAAGEALVQRVSALVTGEGQDAVASAASALFGDRVAQDLGAGGRGERTARIRAYQFNKNLPWLARI